MNTSNLLVPIGIIPGRGRNKPMNDQEKTYQDYRNEIELMADMVEKHINEHDMEPHEAIWQELDSSRWVMMNHLNLKAIEFAENEPVEWKHLVADDSSWWEICQAYAYSCMEADLYEELRRRNVEL